MTTEIKEEEKKMPKQPETLEELCDYISMYSDSIAVRAIDAGTGKWGSFFLTELQSPLAIQEALRFIKEGRIPAIVIKP